MRASSHKAATMGYLIDEHAAHLQAAGCSAQTIDSRIKLLRRLHNYLDHGLGFASTAQLEAFLADLTRRRRKRNTIVNYQMHMRAFFRWADHAGYLDGDPTLTMKRPKPDKFRPKPVTTAQLEVALTKSGEPWRLVFALAYYEGLRAAEIAACRREHITQEWLYVPNGKGGDLAAVPTHPYVWSLVSSRPDGPLFPGATPAHISQGAIRQFKRLGLVDVHVHRLRHKFATDMLDAGADLRTVQECLRHVSVATTQAYTYVTDDRKRAAVAMLATKATEPGSDRLGCVIIVTPAAT